jgi:hypothetical protein
MTEYKCLDYLQKNHLYVPVLPIVLDTHHSQSYQHQDQTIQLKLRLHLMHLMDLTKLFERLLALPEFFE